MDIDHLLPPPKTHQIFIRKQKLYLIFGVVVAVFIITLSINLATTPTSWFGHAQTPGTSGTLSYLNSYVFASPISAKADGSSIIRITVILLTTEGTGISGTQVNLRTDKTLTIDAVSSVTDDFGRAIFDVTTTSQGDYTLIAEAQGAPLPQTVSIVFR